MEPGWDGLREALIQCSITHQTCIDELKRELHDISTRHVLEYCLVIGESIFIQCAFPQYFYNKTRTMETRLLYALHASGNLSNPKTFLMGLYAWVLNKCRHKPCAV